MACACLLQNTSLIEKLNDFFVLYIYDCPEIVFFNYNFGCSFVCHYIMIFVILISIDIPNSFETSWKQRVYVCIVHIQCLGFMRSCLYFHEIFCPSNLINYNYLYVVLTKLFSFNLFSSFYTITQSNNSINRFASQ